MYSVSKLFLVLLVGIHIALTAWGVLGLWEYFAGTKIAGFQNPLFSHGLQFLHFSALIATGVTFLVGSFLRSSLTPNAMLVWYTVLSTLCAVETLDFLVHEYRYLFLFVELATYAIILVYLFKSGSMISFFQREGRN